MGVNKQEQEEWERKIKEYEENAEERYRGLRPEDAFLAAMLSPRAQRAWQLGREERERMKGAEKNETKTK